jgi:hypothetical protein
MALSANRRGSMERSRGASWRGGPSARDTERPCRILPNMHASKHFATRCRLMRSMQ